MFQSVFAFVDVKREPERALSGTVTMNGHKVGSWFKPKGLPFRVMFSHSHILPVFQGEATQHGKSFQHWATVLMVKAIGTPAEVQTCYDMKD